MPCHCQSPNNFEICCQPLLLGERKASSAEELLRSRYSAFVTKNLTYLESTIHPERRGSFNLRDAEVWSNSSTWQGLKIISSFPQENPDFFKINFIASYSVRNSAYNHQELAEFKRENGEWFFWDAIAMPNPIKRATPRIGRNDPCSCGSGKKFKKCCAL